MAIEIKSQTIELTEVTDVIVTERVAHVGSGDRIRELRFIGANDFVLMRLYIRGEDDDAIAITAPEHGH